MAKKPQPKPQFNQSQLQAIDIRHKNTLVSASAGTGKTTVMIERLFRMVKDDDVDLSQVVVVTFTKLAANQMKEKLTTKLTNERDNPKVLAQLEKIDSCAISTLHSFCGNLLRNYFYVVDVDPNYTMLDDVALKNVQTQCFKQVLEGYYQADDETFDNLYKIYSPKRSDDEFVQAMIDLYDKSRAQVDFFAWYDKVRENYLHFEGSPLEQALNSNLLRAANSVRNQWLDYASQGAACGLDFYVDACQHNADICAFAPTNTFRQNFQLLQNVTFASLPRSNSKDWKTVTDDVRDRLNTQYRSFVKECQNLFGAYVDFGQDEATYDQLLDQTAQMTAYIDKAVELLLRFDTLFADTKRKNGVVDFSDLEHFALKILADEKVRSEVQSQYKYVFVDEYQDTNEVQDYIINLLVGNNRLFLVGDVKQSIYGFRGCTPNNFADKQVKFSTDPSCNYVELNQNYRSDNKILNLANLVMQDVMTEDFGKINYRKTSMLRGLFRFKNTKLSPVAIDVAQTSRQPSSQNQPMGTYDLTQPTEETCDEVRLQGLAVAHRIQQLMGSTYVNEETGASRTITYQDIAILSRAKGDYAFQIFNVLLEKNIPVVGSFKMKGLKNKEVRTLISLLRVVDNPHNDVAFVAVLLSPLCGLTEQQLAQIKIATASQKQPFYNRAKAYVQDHNDEITTKLNDLFDKVENYRLFSYGATVDQLLIEVVASTNFHLHVSGLPNASLRVKKMYEFIDQIKDKHYSQSIDKFLQFLDETSFEGEMDDEGANVSAVKFMTMHASKGLEFPVVIIVGANRGIKADNEVITYDANVGLAMDYFNFESGIKAPSLGKFATNQIKRMLNKAEELRLLYVALTRAQNHLVITLANDDYEVWTSKRDAIQDASCFAQWLVPPVAKYLGGFTDGARRDGICVSFLDATRLEDVEGNEQSFLCNQSKDVDAALANLAYVYPHTHQIVPSKITSSTLDGHFFNLKDRQESQGLTWQPLVDEVDKMQLGTAYHKVYETISYDANLQQIQAHLDSLLQQNLITKQVYDQLDVHLIYNTLSNPTFKQIVASGKAYHEVPFLTQTEYNRFYDEGGNAPTLLQGIIDLLVVGQSKATIVDFKYVSNSYNLADRYKKQLQSYKYAVQKILQMDVDCYLLSISDNKLIKVD